MTELVFSRYQLIEVLGQGAMGVVWRAHDTVLDRDIAVKELRPGPGVTHADALDRFLVEARAAARLNHPNIVGIHDVLSDGQRVVIAMELVDGPTLDLVLDATGRLPATTVRAIMAQVAQALAAAHAAGVIHRDLKPDNIFWTANGRAVVADFGLARIGSGGGTVAGTIMGTPGYMAPEQIRGTATGTQADVFGWGAVAYELATGQPAFGHPDTDPAALAYRIVHEDPQPLDLPGDPGLAELITRCLAKDPNRRPQDGGELVRELVGPTVTAAPSSTPDQPRAPSRSGAPAETGQDQADREPDQASGTLKPARNHAALLVGVVGLLVVLAVVITVGLGGTGRGSPRSDVVSTTMPTASTLALAPLPIDGAAIPPGTYRSNSFQPAVALTLTPGWSGDFEAGGLLELSRPDLRIPGDLLSTVTFIQLQSVFDPTRSYESQASYADPTAIQQLPSDVFGWLCQHPRLTHPCQYVPDRIGSSALVRLDVTVQNGYRSEGCNAPGRPCVFTFYHSSLKTRYVLFEGMKYGFYLYHVNGLQVLVAVEAPLGTFDTFLPVAKDLIATASF